MVDMNWKQEIKKYLDEKGIEYKDYGCDSLDSVDYPIYAKRRCCTCNS